MLFRSGACPIKSCILCQMFLFLTILLINIRIILSPLLHLILQILGCPWLLYYLYLHIHHCHPHLIKDMAIISLIPLLLHLCLILCPPFIFNQIYLFLHRSLILSMSLSLSLFLSILSQILLQHPYNSMGMTAISI